VAPSRSIDGQLLEVERLSRQGPSDHGRRALTQLLRSRNNLVAARAAEVAGRWSNGELIPELLRLWERSLADPVKSDRACHAKLAVVDALDDLGYEDRDLFLRGARHVQLEPSYGPPVDSAPLLRARCARILASRGHPDIYVILADLLMDPEPGVRREAAELATELGGERGELLLRMRVLAGEGHTENYATYFRGLLDLSPGLSLPLLESHTRSPNPGVAEEAILALGESRMPEAFPILRGLFEATAMGEDRRGIVLGICLLRLPEAVDFLEEILLHRDSASARYVVEALGVYRGTPEVVARMRAAAEKRGDPGLLKVLEMVVEGEGR
jgi:HEAT repeat protein